MNIYYNFSYPNRNDIEPGLYRLYFKYNPEELFKRIKPYFIENKNKNNIKNIYKKTKLKIKSKILKLPLTDYFGEKDVDILHLFCQLSDNTRIPWISEVECIGQYSNYCKYDAYNPIFIRNLKDVLNDKHCKRIIVNSFVTKKSFEALNLPCEKVSVVYPVVPCGRKINHQAKKSINLLFNFGSNPLFFSKGGREVIKCFEILKRKYNKLSLNILGNDKREKIKLAEGINYCGFVKHKDILEKYIPEADILIHPTHLDAFGYVILEAMSFGLPIVATKHYAIREIIEENKNGLLIEDIETLWYDENYIGKKNYRDDLAKDKVVYKKDEFQRIVDNLVRALKPLIEDENLRQEIGDNNYNKILKGPFSINRRNEKILNIYKEALSE